MDYSSLNERKKYILYYIINEYLNTSEPVGSRTIAKSSDLGISAATIRNEMSDLEEMGFLIKSHASSGRIPSEDAYKLYVQESLNDFRKKYINDKKTSLKLRNNDLNINIEELIGSAAEILSKVTDNVVIFSLERPTNIKIYHVEILKISEFDYVLLTVLKSGEVNSNVFKMPNDLKNEDIKKINHLLNSLIKKNDTIENLKAEFDSTINKSKFNKDLLNNVFRMIKSNYMNLGNIKTNIYGLTNIFNLTEYNNLENIKEFISFINDKENIANLLNKNTNEYVEVYVGTELGIPELEKNSVVLTNIYLNNYYIGRIGVIGPLRMDYKNTISTLYNISWRVVNMIN